MYARIVLKVGMPPAHSVVQLRLPACCSEFQTPDEEMKKIVLKVVKQCVGTEGVEPEYIRTEVGAAHLYPHARVLLPGCIAHCLCTPRDVPAHV